MAACLQKLGLTPEPVSNVSCAALPRYLTRITEARRLGGQRMLESIQRFLPRGANQLTAHCAVSDCSN